MKTKIIVSCFLLFFLCEYSFSDEIDPPKSLKFGPSVKDFFDLSESANPDSPCFVISYIDEKANAMFGADIGISGFFSKNFNFLSFLTPFINLYNNPPISIIPWQLWRGSIGFKNYFELKKIFHESARLIFQIGITHESDHFTGYNSTGTYYWEGVDTYFSFYDYIDPQVFLATSFLKKKAGLILSAAYKYNIDKHIMITSARNIIHSFCFELISDYRLNDNSRLFFSCFHENMKSNPDLGGYIFHNSGNFPKIRNINKNLQQYLYLKLGFNVRSSGGHIYQPYMIYSNSSGRGVDFLLKEKAFGFGLKILI